MCATVSFSEVIEDVLNGKDADQKLGSIQTLVREAKDGLEVDEALRAILTVLADTDHFEAWRAPVVEDPRFSEALLSFEPDDDQERRGMFICLYLLSPERLMVAKEHIFRQFQLATEATCETYLSYQGYMMDAISTLVVIGDIDAAGKILDFIIKDDGAQAYELLKRVSEMEEVGETAIFNILGGESSDPRIRVLIDQLRSCNDFHFKYERSMAVLRSLMKGEDIETAAFAAHLILAFKDRVAELLPDLDALLGRAKDVNDFAHEQAQIVKERVHAEL